MDKRARGKIINISLMLLMLGVLLGSFGAVASQEGALAISSKDNIVTDEEYRDYQAMSLAEIQSFLENPRWGDGYLGRPSYLATYTTTDYQGVQRSTAEIIYNAARDYLSQGYQISPEVILTTLQKEQSLITEPSPSEYALNWAMQLATTTGKVSENKLMLVGGSLAMTTNILKPTEARTVGVPEYSSKH